MKTLSLLQQDLQLFAGPRLLERDAERRLVEKAQALSAEDVRQAAQRVLIWDEAFVVEVQP